MWLEERVCQGREGQHDWHGPQKSQPPSSPPGAQCGQHQCSPVKRGFLCLQLLSPYRKHSANNYSSEVVYLMIQTVH